ncbi:MAG: hypothetical protein U0271_00285 [Polyangiaceae bacterium]
MTTSRDELRGRLAAAQSDDDVRALSTELSLRALMPFRVASALMREPNPSASDNGNVVLAGAGELSITPLVESRMMSAADTAWAMEHVVATRNELCRRTVRFLEPLLGDMTEVQAPEPPPVSRAKGAKAAPKKPATRVCDIAYLTLLRTLLFSEDEVDPKMTREKFLSYSHKRRDAFITGIARTWTFRRARGEGR